MDSFFSTQPSSRPDSSVSAAFASPPRPTTNLILPRRFTGEPTTTRVPILSTLANITRPTDAPDFAAAGALHKVQLLEKKRQDYERLKEHRRRFEAEISKLDAQQRQEERELQQLAEDLNARFGGHQSEPTTPPEYRDSSGFPSIFSRPNRYSTSSLTSPQSLFSRPVRSVLTSPLSGTLPSRFAFDDTLPSHSLLSSRRNSNDDEKEAAVRQDPTSHRSTNTLNRYSMPVTRSRTYFDIGLEDSNNTTGFLFGDEDSNTETKTTPTAPVGSSDVFSFLSRPTGFASMASTTSSAAPDFGLSQTSATDFSSNGWSSINKHRQSMSTIGQTQLNGAASVGSPSETSTIGSARPANMRHSVDGSKFFPESSAPSAETPAPASTIVSPPSVQAMASPPKLHQSYSASDVPAVKPNGSTTVSPTGANNHAQQHLQNHNAALGRIPASAVPARHSRELSADVSPPSPNARETTTYPSITSTLQASAPPFGPVSTQPQQPPATAAPTMPVPAPMPYPFYPAAPPYQPINAPPAGYQALPMLMQNMSISNGNPPPMYPQQNFTGYGPLYNPAPAPRQSHDSQARVIQSRRQMDSEAMARYNNLSLEQCAGNIYSLCKDQHGCRYLQKQLENRIPAQIHMIWLEVNQHIVELMMDPFGNYLCQKLVEFCSDEERTVLIQNAAPEMVRIALNQHGTRALQKMIEHVTTPAQVNLIVEALRHQVVELIQDLNGNHVIQKCLNKLSATDASFIFDAVGKNCVEVGTHRHGCCVLQRCIDHADGAQKVWLIECITAHAVTLVQDPFGNYVVQYIIDLNEETFTEPLVNQFKGRIISLSKHKFSSNVVEKCLRCASDAARDMIVNELLTPGEMERLLRDSFANYVIQTALDYATANMKPRLVEAIRPSLPSIRATPYGRRIQAKIQAYDARGTTTNNGQTPTDPSGGQVSVRSSHNRNMQTSASILNAPAYANGNSAANGVNGTNANNSRAGTGMYPSSTMIAVPPPRPAQPQTAPVPSTQAAQAPRAQQQAQPPQQFLPLAPATQNGEGQWV